MTTNFSMKLKVSIWPFQHSLLTDSYGMNVPVLGGGIVFRNWLLRPSGYCSVMNLLQIKLLQPLKFDFLCSVATFGQNMLTFQIISLIYYSPVLLDYWKTWLVAYGYTSYSNSNGRWWLKYFGYWEYYQKYRNLPHSLKSYW